MKPFYFLIYFFVALPAWAQIEQSPTDFSECDFTAIAHRGYSEFYPENTLVAIEEAFKRGIKYCEVDVAISSDGVYVLHHDPYTIARTTSGQGTVGENTYAQLAALDAGGWKATYFKGAKVPTLSEALRVAQKYDAHLYLDVKDFSAAGLAEALNEANVDASRMMPAITNMEAAYAFRQYCPDSPWVWFGPDPDDPNDISWFEERMTEGCRAFELTDEDVLLDWEWSQSFIQSVHAVGGKVWAYTVNNENRIQELADLGVDGVETDRPYVAQLYVCGYNPVSTYPKHKTNGNWNFKGENFEQAGVGSPLRNFATDDHLLQAVEYGRTDAYGISSINGIDTTVVKIPAYNPENGLFAYDNFMMEDSGAVDYTYSVIMDILIESKDSGDYIALIQTSPDNLNDADYFIAPDASMGTFGEYHGEFTFDVWHRVVFVHDGYQLKKYLDGELIGQMLIEGSRWTVFNNMAYHGKHGLLLFSDDNEETATIYANAIQLRNYAMGTDEISALGGADASGIPMNNKKVFSTGIPELESEMIDWEQRAIFIKQKAGESASNVSYSLELSDGASASISTSGTFNLDEGEITFQVVAADGSYTDWTIQRLLTVGVNDQARKLNAAVYPNPFSCNLKVNLHESASFELYTMTGQLVYVNRNLVKGENSLDIAHLSAGSYLYKLRSSAGYSDEGILVKTQN